MEDQGIDSFCGKMPDKRDQISTLAIKNFKPALFMFKMMEQHPMPYGFNHVSSRRVLEYQHQWELEKKKMDNLEAPKVDKDNGAKTLENIVFHLKFIRGVFHWPMWCISHLDMVLT